MYFWPLSTIPLIKVKESQQNLIKSLGITIRNCLNLTYYGPFAATPDIGGGTMYPHISYACSICSILMKLSKIKQLDK